jgi:peptide/nickel transport system substrate-binding protein
VAFKEGAAPAGIRVDVQRVSSDLFWDSYWSVEPFTVTWWAGRPNPDLAMSIQYQGSWNAPNFFNDEFDELIVRGRGETLEKQKVTYARIQEILIDEVPQLVVAFRPMLYGARKNVRGVVPHPLGPIAIILQDGWLDD